MKHVTVLEVSPVQFDKNNDPYVVLEVGNGKKDFILINGELREIIVKPLKTKVLAYQSRENLAANGVEIVGLYDHLGEAQQGMLIEGVIRNIEIEPVTEVINGKRVYLTTRAFFIPVSPDNDGYNKVVGQVVRAAGYTPKNPAYHNQNRVLSEVPSGVTADEINDPNEN